MKPAQNESEAIMIVRHHGRAYEITGPRPLYFKLLQLWFPFHRLIRLCRRCAKRLVVWPFVLGIFLPVAYLVLSLFAAKGICSIGDVYFELASIALSSCLLLAIKDNMDCERERSKALKRQFAYYTRIKYSLYDSLDSVFSSFGLPHVVWDALSSRDRANELKRDYRNGGNRPTASDATAVAIANSRALLDGARLAIADASYIDWGVSEADDRAFDVAMQALGQLELSLRGCDNGSLFNTIDALVDSYLQILAGLRRPWNYPRDKARERLVSNYFEAHAVKI